MKTPPSSSGKHRLIHARTVFKCAAVIMVFAWAWQLPCAAGTTSTTPISTLFAGQASYINNAEPQPVGQLDAEPDLTYTHNRQSDYIQFPLTLTYGLMPRWDVSAAVGVQWQSYSPANGNRQTASGFSDIPIYTKFKLLDQDQWWCSQSLEFEINVPTASREQGLGTGNPNYDLTWLASKDFTDKLTGDLNLGYTLVGNDSASSFSNQLHYGLALEYSVTDKLGLNAQFLTSVPDSQMNHTEVALSTGIGWQATPRFQMHASVTEGIGAGNQVIEVSATVGATWSFGKHAAPNNDDGAKTPTR
jgi:hypothetical protein